MSRRTRLLAILAVSAVATFAYNWLRPTVDCNSVAAVFNADSTSLRLSFGDSASGTPERIPPRSSGRTWPVEAELIFIERELGGATPLVFDLRPHLSIMGADYVLAFHGTSLFVVDRDAWPKSGVPSATLLGRIASAVITPIG